MSVVWVPINDYASVVDDATQLADVVSLSGGMVACTIA